MFSLGRTRVELEKQLGEVSATIRQVLEQTPLLPLLDQVAGSLYGGKMLRSRLALRLGAAAGTPRDALVRGCAAIEMLHAASLLHDDVIDGASLRRNAPAFWVSRGTSGSILVGDLMTCSSFSLLVQAGGEALVAEFVARAREMCEAEVEQELIRREFPDWASCVKFARGKTGSLFAFVGYLAAGKDATLASLTRECGYLAGTAYQLADDLFDSYGDPASSDKSLGLDALKVKTTGASGWRIDKAGAPPDPVAYIRDLLAKPAPMLNAFPAVESAWQAYLEKDLGPGIDRFVRNFKTTF